MPTGKLGFVIVLALAPLAASARPAPSLSPLDVKSPATMASVGGLASPRIYSTSDALGSRTNQYRDLLEQRADPAIFAGQKPLERSLNKGWLLLLLAALAAHQLRRNQRLLSRQLTGT